MQSHLSNQLSTCPRACPDHPTLESPRCRDVLVVLSLIRELAEYENALEQFIATEQSLDATSKDRKAEDSEQGTGNLEEIAGFALYFHNYSSWISRPSIFLEDLFVRPQHRGKGYGTALLSALAVEVAEIDGARLDWTVSRWNETSIRFYESKVIGASMLMEKAWMRIEGLELKRLARKSAEKHNDKGEEDRSVE